jgi:arginine utilization protein RocB
MHPIAPLLAQDIKQLSDMPPDATPPLFARTRHWAETLTAIPSVTGTADEASFGIKLEGLLRHSPASRQLQIWRMDVPGGNHSCECVFALLRGRGRETVILTGHFDTVETDCYGDLQPLALDPPALTAALIDRLGKEPPTAQSQLALADLTSGNFLPGRGLLDMKAGLAAGLAVIEQSAGVSDRRGNLLFIAVPDEEANSAGARHMAQVLPQIAKYSDLEFIAAINLDAIADDEDGTTGRAIALGSIGKLLPSALVIGRSTHASYAFRGLSAAALAGAVATEMEWASDLTERTGDQLSAGPTLLGMKDNKRAYDVTTPESVWMYWNVATHRRSPDEVLANTIGHARRAVTTLDAALEQRRAAVAAEGTSISVEILTYATLLASVVTSDPQAERAIADLATTIAHQGLDIPEQCRQVTEYVWRLSGRSGPAIIVGFASTPYLPVSLSQSEGARRLESAARAVAAEADETVSIRAFFPAISDVSFFGEADEAGLLAIGANTPVWRSALNWPEGAAVAGIPTLNMGPWGRDYHTRLERLHVGYAFGTLPKMLAALTRRLLAP